jgi:large subunit ribosomal protein L22
MAEEARAVAKYVRMTPTKVRRVMALIRGKDVPQAMDILKFTPNRASEVLSKVLKSAAANHMDRFGSSPEELQVSTCFVDPGPTLKRIQPRAMGRAYRILKRTSHVTIVVSERETTQRRGRPTRRAAHSHAGHTHDHDHDHDHAGHSH